MNLERGAVNTFLVSAREVSDPAYYLMVFQQVIDPSNYQYVIATNSGSAHGPLLLSVLEKDGADAFAAEVTLGTGDWLLEVYEQSSALNLDAALALRKIWSEQVTVFSGSATAPVYPPDPCGEVCPVGNITNSNNTYTNTVASGGTLVLADVTHTDSDGSPVVRPGMVAFVATPCGAPVVDFYYAIAIGHP